MAAAASFSPVRLAVCPRIKAIQEESKGKEEHHSLSLSFFQ
jgi:hypothetical protein